MGIGPQRVYQMEGNPVVDIRHLKPGDISPMLAGPSQKRKAGADIDDSSMFSVPDEEASTRHDQKRSVLLAVSIRFLRPKLTWSAVLSARVSSVLNTSAGGLKSLLRPQAMLLGMYRHVLATK